MIKVVFYLSAEVDCHDVDPESIKRILEEETCLVSPVLDKTVGNRALAGTILCCRLQMGLEPELAHKCILFCVHGDYLKGELRWRVPLSDKSAFLLCSRLWNCSCELKNWLLMFKQTRWQFSWGLGRWLSG